MPDHSHLLLAYGRLDGMAGMNDPNLARHFGRQLRKERIAHGWTIAELSRRSGLDPGHLSRIETGRRPPTAKIAQAMDQVFPGRNGWFSDWHAESREWSESAIPPGFRSWAEYEDGARSLWSWSPSIFDGLLQTEDYTRALIMAVPRVTSETVAARLTSRLDRQRRVLLRDDGPNAVFVVDEVALYRRVGSAAVMAAQLARVLEVARLPHVTVQVLPLIAHAANASGLLVADGSTVWCEHMAGGYVITDEAVVSSLALRFDSLRAECWSATESADRIGRMRDQWVSGVSPATATVPAGSA
jgi:transcriptional regulator with XRE-family HTH domain